MFTTSTVVALAAHDSTLGNEHEIVNCICILVATHSNGTPFTHNSFQEEDLVELCVGLGQAHPESVAWILETEAVLVFWSTSELMATMHLLGAAIAWYNEPIKLHVCPPTST